MEENETIIGYGGIIFNVLPQLQERIPAHYLGATIDGAVAVVEQLIRNGTPNPSVAAEQFFEEALQQYEWRRALIESHIWNSFSASGNSSKHLSEMNEEFAGVIMAALRFGVDDILSPDMSWNQHLVNSYRVSEEDAQAYLSAYHQAAKTHFFGAGMVVADLLSEIAVNRGS